MTDLTELAAEVLGHQATLNQAADRYLVLCMCQGKPIWQERDDADCDWGGTSGDIISGQIENVIQVVKFNVAERTCEDASVSFAEHVCAVAEKAGGKLRPDLHDFVEHVLGIEAARGLREAA